MNDSIHSCRVLVVSIDDFLADGEPIRREDLTAWVTVGKEHVPRSEGMPLLRSQGGSRTAGWSTVGDEQCWR